MATDRLPDRKQEGLTAPLQGYLDTRGKTSSLWSGRVSLTGKGADPNMNRIWNIRILKVRPHGQKFSRTTWYNMVVRHKTCRGCGSVDSKGDVCRATF